MAEDLAPSCLDSPENFNNQIVLSVMLKEEK